VRDGTKVLHLSQPHEDAYAALEAVADAISAPKEPVGRAEYKRPDLPDAPFSALTIGQIIARFLPENAIISDEGATSSGGTMTFTATGPVHDHLSLTGGSVGQGMPLAIGVAVACPDRKVVNLQADGSGMYTLQALWTQARERLDVTTVIFSNRSYAILNIELGRVGAGQPGPKALSLLDLHNPDLDWVQLARGMGVEASRAQSNAELAAQFESAMKQRGPRLIEVVI
jgi:acetolactate synthase-1/2/3 large subunit